MSKMNFAIALKMTTDQFKQGADIVKRSLRQIQYQVLGMASALGLGTIGLKNMVSRFVDVARETTRARVALRNISGDAQGFSKNMDFLVRTSNRWGQELNGMTSEFAKFSAAASSAGISIQDQHTIFESFTRSITAFGMSSEDAHLSYLALSQMMSKGKISSEELRRQLGERMPVAMEAMARAVGVTIQELDGLLKAGKLISKDVMLPFVKEMEKMLPEVNTDNIETSVNRLKNTFTQLTQDLKIGEYFKKIVDWANSMLGNIQTSFMRVVAVIVAAFTSGKIAKAYSSLTQKVVTENQKVLANKVQTEQQLELATAKRVAAEKRYNEISALYSKATNEQKIQYYAKLTAAESAMNKARLREQAGLKAVQEANAAQMVTRWGVAFNGLKKVAISAIATIKAAFSTILPMAVIGLITNFVMKLVEARKEAKEIKNIFSEYRKEAESLSTPKEVAMLETSLSVLNDKKSTQDELNKAQSTLNSLLGTEISNQDELNKKVNERIRLLKASAEADFYVNKGLSAQDEINTLYSKYGGAQKMDEKMRLRGSFSSFKKSIGIDSQIDRDYARIQELQKVVADAGWKVDAAVRAGVDLSGGGGSKSQYTPSDPSGDDNQLQKAEKKYAEELIKLANQKAVNAISEKEYNKALGDLSKATYEEIAGILGINAANNATYQAAKRRMYNIDNISAGDVAQKVIEANKHKFKPISGGASMVGYDPRDTTFDYKKSESDILEEEYGQLEKYIQRLREEGKVAMEEIWKEEQKLTSLSDALKLSQLKEDIKEMNLSIFEQSIDGVTGFADALDRAARSWSRIANEDMSGFERMVSIINAIGDTVKGLMGTWEAYTALRDLISTKEQAIQAKDNILNAQKIANVSTLAAVEQGAAAASLATKSTEVAANTTVAASGAAASVAGIPLVGPMLAVGAVASILGLLGGLPKFADGGIFAGLKGGDRNLARLNGGEMIMTTPQQSKLWGAIKNGDFGGIGGKVEFEIKGKKLVGVLGNQSKRSARV